MIKNSLCILFLIVILISFSGCDNSNKAKIKGIITGAEGRKLCMIEVGNPSSVADSVHIDEDGKFTRKFEITKPADLVLYFKKDDFIRLIVLPGETIILKAEANRLMQSYQVEGGETSVQIKYLYAHLQSNLQRIDSLNQVYHKYQNTDQLDSVLKSLNRISEEIYINERGFLVDFIEKNPSSPASYLALSFQLSRNSYIFKPQEDIRYFKLVDSALTLKHPETDMVKMLHSFVVKTEEQIAIEEAQNQRIGIGAVAPEIALLSPQGDTVRLSKYRRKYVLLDFWAAWCKPCRLENPNLVKMYQKYHWKGFEIFQVSLDKSKDEWKKAIREDQLWWIQCSDLKFWSSAPALVYQVQSIPANFLLDPEGKIIARNLQGDKLAAKLSELFDKKPIR